MDIEKKNNSYVKYMLYLVQRNLIKIFPKNTAFSGSYKKYLIFIGGERKDKAPGFTFASIPGCARHEANVHWRRPLA